MRRFLQHYDVYLTPVVSGVPLRTGEQAPTRPFDELMAAVLRYVSYTPTASIAGLPAMSVPLSSSPEGLPIGSHFMAGHGREAMLLALAYELEAARPWAARWPAMAWPG